MADKAISELVAASAVSPTDLFVLEQGGTAKKMTGQTLENWLVHLADGHGGIQTIEKTSTSGLNDTYTITFADTTTSTFTVKNGRALQSIATYYAVSSNGTTPPTSWSLTRQNMTSTNRYLWSYQSFTYNDGSRSASASTVIGVYGDTGAQTYVWIKYAAVRPTSNSDVGDNPDKWIGIYVGLSDTAPTSYTEYTWYEYKGEKGDTGDAAAIVSQSVTYLESSSGTVIPSGSWTTTIPSVTPGNYLWTRTQLTFNDDTETTAYSVSRFGIDGTGSVSTVNNQSPDTNGNIALTANNVPTSDNQSVQTHLDEKYVKPSGGIPASDLASAVLSPYRTAAAQDAIDAAQDAQIESISRRNLLDNWYFVGGGSQLGEGIFPINQKGQTTYTASGITIDRWKSSASSISCTVNSGNDGNVLVKATAASAQWYQILSNQSGLAGKKVTLSALTTAGLIQTTVDIPSTLPTGTQTIGSGTGDVNGYSLYVRTISGKLAAVVYAGSSFSSTGISLIAVKLEVGSSQTLAHNEGTEANPNWVLNEIPDYGEELAKCQRYLFSVTTDAFFVGTTGSNHTNPTFFVPTPVTMAKNPTTQTSISVNAQHGSGYVNDVTVTVSSCIAVPNGVRINTTGSTAIGTANYAMCLIQSKNTIYLSAES